MTKYVSRYFISAGILFALASLTAALPAHATILAGNSNSSTFSNLNCSSCGDTTLTSTQVTLGTSANGGSSSTLSIDTSFAFSEDVTATGVPLAELTLAVGNKPGTGQTGVTFDYNLVLTFTIPGGTSLQTFSDTISGNGGSGSNGEVTLSGLNLTLTDPLVLPDVTLSDFRFSGTGYSNGSWTVGGQSSGVLYLLADVTDTSTTGGDTEVPEPGTLAILGSGLIGLMYLRRRAKRI